MVSTHEVGFCFFCDTPVLLQMLNLVGIRCGKIGDHASVVAGDDDTTTSSWLLFVISVANSESGLLVGVLENFGVFVVADAAEEDYGIGLEQVLW